MRGFLIGIAIALAVVGGLTTLRGGLRARLYNAGRRLKLALILAGVYLVTSAALRLAAPPSWSDWGLPGLALLLAAVFIVVGQDRELGGQAPASGEHQQPGQR